VNQKTFDNLWQTYWLDVQRLGPLTYSRYRLLLAEVPSALPPRPRVLDIGCGSGAFLRLLLTKAPDALLNGVEISTEAWRAAPEELRPRIRNGEIIEVSSQFEPGSFDLIVCSEVLEHVPDPAAVLRVIFSLLKPGGAALLTVPGGMQHWSVQDEVAGHLRRFEFGDFAMLLRDCGFVAERQYGWGGPVGTLYNGMISSVGPVRAARSAGSAPVRLFAWFMRVALRMDDFFKSDRRFQLIARASRPIDT
jgi:SAM-dependent methyltransferase